MKDKKILPLLLGILVFAGPLQAVEPAGPKGITLERKSFTAEAAEAVFGRIFGVQDQGGDIDYHVVELSDQTPLNAAVRSAMLPGWGQFFNGQDRKGALLMGTTVIFGTAAALTYLKSRDFYHAYENSGQKDSPAYNDYSNRFTLSMVLAGATAVLWGYGIYDAAKNGSAYSTGQDQSIQLSLAPDQTQVSWHKRF